MSMESNQPHFIYLTGCDGTGKSTQSRLLVDYLKKRHPKVKNLWLRFPFFFSLPFLVYARWRKFSWVEVHEGVKYGYWDFRPSWVMRHIFPWVYFLDAALASFWRVYLPLLGGTTIVCERFVLDMIVDLTIALADSEFHASIPGQLLQKLLPKPSQIILLSLDAHTIRLRRKDLAWDRKLEDRIQAYQNIAQANGIAVVSSTQPTRVVSNQIGYQIGLYDDQE
jgi:thymidylate kinase